MTKDGYICSICGEVKPLEGFEHWETIEKGTKKTLRVIWCRECQRRAEKKEGKNDER